MPQGWWDDYIAMAAREYDPGVMMTRSSLMGYTWTETMQMLEPVGIDRWPFDLSLKFGMRDDLTCSVGRRWLVSLLVAPSAQRPPHATFPYRTFRRKETATHAGA